MEKEKETRLTLEIDTQLINKYFALAEKKLKQSGISLKLSKKQALYMGIKEITEIWEKELQAQGENKEG